MTTTSEYNKLAFLILLDSTLLHAKGALIEYG